MQGHGESGIFFLIRFVIEFTTFFMFYKPSIFLTGFSYTQFLPEALFVQVILQRQIEN